MSLIQIQPRDLDFAESKTPLMKLETWSDAARGVRVRGFTEDQLWTCFQTTNSDRSVNETYHEISDIPLCVWILNETAAKPGQLYVRLTLTFGGPEGITLCQGYLHDGHQLTWPGGLHTPMSEGPGYVHVVSGTDPAANTEISEVVPTNAVWRLLGFHAQLVTDANAANRIAILKIGDGTDVMAELTAEYAHTASKTRDYYWNTGSIDRGEQAGNAVVMKLPLNWRLPEGFTIETEVDNIQATDNWGEPHLLVEEWIQE